MLARERQRAVHESADTRKALEIAVDDRLAFILRQAEPSRNAPGRASIENGEVDCLRLVAGVAVDSAEQLLSSDCVDILAGAKRLLQLRHVCHVRGEPQLDL